MNYYNEIKKELIDNEINKKIKDYSKNNYELIKYLTVGKLLNQAGKKYGEGVIEKYSKKLEYEVGKKYNKSTLFKIKKFYLVFSNQKVAPLVPQLCWSHCLILLPLKDINAINYYILQIVNRNLSKRQLIEIVKNNEYERLDENTKNKLKNHKEMILTDFVKNPIIIRNKNNYKNISEKILQKLILEDIEYFMKELGNGFSFIGSEYKIKIANTYNYIDLLLYNIKYHCYVVIELKVTDLNYNHTGQIQNYMNYIDKNIKDITDNDTVGIIICKKNNEYIIEYCSDSRIISRSYELV
ncbi:MAG: DUF1016 family protein [Bacilli bacterium]|nr:DUF1016 family protein [Bacilli bacterium]